MQRTVLTLALAILTASPGEAQWSIAEPLSQARINPASVTVGNFVLFAGGRDGSTLFDRVDIYDTSIGPPSDTAAWSQHTLLMPQTSIAATALGSLAFFGGGAVDFGVGTNVVEVFDSETMLWSTAKLSVKRVAVSATSVGNKVLFAGGGKIGTTYKRVDIYDASLGGPDDEAAWSIASLSQARAGICAVTVGDLAIFAGGSGVGGVEYADVDIYDDSTGLWSTAPPLSSARLIGDEGGVAVGARAYFAGGHFSQAGGPNMSGAVDIYDASLGLPTDPAAWSTISLAAPRGYIAATAVGNRVLFAGGVYTGFIETDLVEVLDAATGQWAPSMLLSQARAGLTGATIGGKALFAGGQATGGAVSAVVDVFETCPGGPPSSELVRLGSPPNPNALLPGATSGPVIGAIWDPAIDHTSFLPGSVLDFLVMSATPSNIPFLGGSLLCGATPFLTLTSSPGTPFALPLPSDCNLVGVSLCTQGAGIDGALTIALTNALDITIGSY